VLPGSLALQLPQPGLCVAERPRGWYPVYLRAIRRGDYEQVPDSDIDTNHSVR
jgi:hypothetical protein